MALALLRPSRVPGLPGTVAFDVELGTNRFYQVAVGDATVDRAAGFPMLGAPAWTSSVVGPLPDASRGRTTVEIPASRLDRDNRSVQLTSFRTRQRHGPAVSEIVRVAVPTRAQQDFPNLAFSLRHPMETYTVDAPRAAPWTYAEPMAYREVRPVSSAMFLGKIIPMLSGLVSKVAPVVKQLIAAPVGGGQSPLVALIGGLLAGKQGAGGAPGTPAESVIKPETAELLTQLLQQLAQPGNAVAPAPTPPTPPAQAKSFAVNQRYAAAAEYSHAAVAPALLAALPALMPLLEKVLTPETIKGVLDTVNPTKVIGAVTDSVKEIGKLGLEFDKQSNEHLRALNPMGVHAPVDDLLKGMGLASSLAHDTAREKGEPAYRRVESVELVFAGASPVTIHGRSRVCYRAGDQIAFALDVKTPRPIAEAKLSLLVKNPETRKILVRKTLGISQLTSGRLPKRVELSGDELKPLKAGEEYLVCAYLTWKNAKGKIIGTSRTQQITLIGEYVFDRVDAGTVVPLNDVAKHRPFWHKIWEGALSKEHYKVNFDGKYYYVLEPGRDNNAPIATTTKFAKNGEKVKRGKIKAGMTTSLGALNALIPIISTGKPLPEPQLGALRSSDFVSRFNTAARFQVALSGKPGVTAALWIYPEVKLHDVVLFKAASTDADSHVRELVEERVKFPIPVSLHVIGARTTR